MMADIAEEGVASGGLSDRIITTLQLADRRGYSLSLTHLSRMLIHGEAHEEEVGREINGMIGVSNHDGICCLKGREHLIPETRRRLFKMYFPQIYHRDSCETNVRKTLTARILHLIYTNYVVSKLGERMCKGTSTFLGGLYSSHTGITSKPSLCEVGD